MSTDKYNFTQITAKSKATNNHKTMRNFLIKSIIMMMIWKVKGNNNNEERELCRMTVLQKNHITWQFGNKAELYQIKTTKLNWVSGNQHSSKSGPDTNPQTALFLVALSRPFNFY